jgi:hypothetical protein
MSNRSLKVHYLERGKLACCTRGRVLKVTGDVHAVTCNICLYFTGRYTPLVKREELKRRHSTVDLTEFAAEREVGVLGRCS